MRALLVAAIFDFAPSPGLAAVTIGAATSALLATWAFARVGPAAELQRRTGRMIPEMRGYGRKTLEDYLAKAGPGGRDLYRRELCVDFGYLAVYGPGLAIFFVGTWLLVLKPSHGFLRWAILVAPLLLAVVDVVEDTLLRRIVNPGEKEPVLRAPHLVPMASTVTTIKLVLVAVVVLVALAGPFFLAFAGVHRF